MKLKNIQLEKGFKMIKCFVVSLGSYTSKELTKSGYTEDEITEIINKRFDT
jgi:hypothetical protein